MKEVQERTQDLRLSLLTTSSHTKPLLEWLWDTVSRPSLEALGFNNPVSDDNWPRVWWIPTGVLSLTFYAAGYYARGSTETVLDRVMSPYASSVKALRYGRRHVLNGLRPMSNHALLVAMRETPGLTANGTLPFAAAEVGILNDLCRSLELTPIRPTLRKKDVLKHLQGCRIFHFAGHGQSHPTKPSESCLLLEDWKTNPLTVGDLRDHRLQENPPFLGYLSACSTEANEADRLADADFADSRHEDFFPRTFPKLFPWGRGGPKALQGSDRDQQDASEAADRHPNHSLTTGPDTCCSGMGADLPRIPARRVISPIYGSDMKLLSAAGCIFTCRTYPANRRCGSPLLD